MIGWVYAMQPHDYQTWLTQGGAEGSLASTGEKLFHQYGCSNCHHFDGHGRAPNLQGLYGRAVEISGMGIVTANETYLRESILDPKAKIVDGFQAIMPTFQGQLSEDDLIALISYIKAIGPAPGAEMPSSSGNGPAEMNKPGIAGPGRPPLNGPKPGEH